MPSKAIPYLKALQADPVNYITHFTGNWALWILLGDLAITPFRRLTMKLAWLIRFRRMVGLYAFFYATLHLLTYVLLFSGYDVPGAIAGLQAHHFAEPWRQFKLVGAGGDFSAAGATGYGRKELAAAAPADLCGCGGWGGALLVDCEDWGAVSDEGHSDVGGFVAGSGGLLAGEAGEGSGEACCGCGFLKEKAVEAQLGWGGWGLNPY
jgi:hypothetical protein